MDIRKLKKLIDLLQKSDIDELEIQEGEEFIRISRYSHNPSIATSKPQNIYPPSEISSVPITTSTKQTTAEQSGYQIKSPMVGIFYTSPSPSSPEFVKVGQYVKEGDILCILEAMKMMNQIKVDQPGTIKAILVENGQPVEYDQPLFTIL